jgi:hypothetical protein
MDYTDEAIYAEYPRKVGKADALRAIRKFLLQRCGRFMMQISCCPYDRLARLGLLPVYVLGDGLAASPDRLHR